MTPRPIVLGKVYCDPISGFVGTATGRAEYLGNTPDVRLTADTGPAGELSERWIPETRIEPFRPPSSGFGSPVEDKRPT